jgi:predicted site-specific integrase-resolvase
MREYATRDVAKQLGLSLITLKRYIAAKKIPVPPLKTWGNVRVRVWSEHDIEAIRAVLPSIKNGRKTRYQRKKQTKKKPKR